ncbi:MAG: PAS domain S-box protein [Gammaproteobacteria bacterium]|nr:PAS domain S-box protein [Gammaproteobacteria bacterium]
MKDEKNIGFTKNYVFALSLIALFSILAFFNLSHLIEAQSQDGEVINISGRQRMLSQKIALYSLKYSVGHTEDTHKELIKNIKLMEKSHLWLTEKKKSEKLTNMYFSEPYLLDNDVKRYINKAKLFLEREDKSSLNYILSNSQKLLKHLDKAVYAYQIENEEKILILQRNELFIVIIILATLFFEAIFIFRPANASIFKKTEELETQRFKADLVIESNRSAIIAINEQMQVYVFNKSAEQMFGYSKKEMLNQDSLNKIMRTDDYVVHQAGADNYMKTGHSSGIIYSTQELIGKRKNGELFPLRISFGTSKDVKNTIVVANIQDISDEKQKEHLILRQSKLAAMGEMIGAIAHQWRQPLNALNINIENLEDDYEDEVIDKEYIEKFIKDQTDTIQFMSKTIDDFRNFFRIDKGKEIFSVKKSIESIFNIQSAQLNNHNIFFDISGEDFTINGFNNEFQQVILNIVSNAKDSILNSQTRNGNISISIQKGIIKINDNGGGIPENIVNRVFEPYFTTKEQGEGTGMGLYMSKMIIEDNMDGMITASNVDDGAEFIIILEVCNG